MHHHIYKNKELEEFISFNHLDIHRAASKYIQNLYLFRLINQEGNLNRWGYHIFEEKPIKPNKQSRKSKYSSSGTNLSLGNVDQITCSHHSNASVLCKSVAKNLKTDNFLFASGHFILKGYLQWS